ncbi:MAG: hypothetical protein PHN82_02435 [bacterium]|nr:hypothetical protein [bacterium]
MRPCRMPFVAALAAAVCAAAGTSPADIVRLRNGEIIECKVVKEMDDLIKVRKPYRGRIVTTFLARGTVESITRSSDQANRSLFQEAGVRNPSRDFEPVYYSGIHAAGRGKGAPGAPRVAGAQPRQRGVDARRERMDQALDRRSGDRTRATSETASSAPFAPTAPLSPSTTAAAEGSIGTGVTAGGTQ